RSRYSLTVLRATRTLCAIARCDWPAAWSRSTSLILRMDNRSAGISSSAGFIVPRKGMPAQGFRLSSTARSRGGRLPPESVAGITGMGGRLPPESVAGMDRNQWPASAGIGGRIRPEYAFRFGAPVQESFPAVSVPHFVALIVRADGI